MPSPSSRECRGVGHLPAGDEGERRVGGQPQQVDDPASGDLLDHRRRRAGCEESRVLIPRRHQPVSSECRRQRATDHEAEESAGAHRHQATILDGIGHAIDDVCSVGGVLGSRPTESGPKRVRGRGWRDQCCAQAGPLGDAAFGNGTEKIGFVHARRPYQEDSERSGRNRVTTRSRRRLYENWNS